MDFFLFIICILAIACFTTIISILVSKNSIKDIAEGIKEIKEEVEDIKNSGKKR